MCELPPQVQIGPIYQTYQPQLQHSFLSWDWGQCHCHAYTHGIKAVCRYGFWRYGRFCHRYKLVRKYQNKTSAPSPLEKLTSGNIPAEDGLSNGEELGDPCCRWAPKALGDFQVDQNFEYRSPRASQLVVQRANGARKHRKDIASIHKMGRVG